MLNQIWKQCNQDKHQVYTYIIMIIKCSLVISIHIYDILYVVILDNPEILYDTPTKVKNESSRQHIGIMYICNTHILYIFMQFLYCIYICILQIHIYH